MKKETIIRKVNKHLKEMEEEKLRYSAAGKARAGFAMFFCALKELKMDLKKLE